MRKDFILIKRKPTKLEFQTTLLFKWFTSIILALVLSLVKFARSSAKDLILSPIVPYTYLRICFSNRILALNQSLHKIRISWFYIVKILFGGEKGDFIYLLINAYIALITQLYVQYFQVAVTLKVWDLIRFYL